MARVHHTDRGSGYPIILIHGFPFNHHIWDDFAAQLEKSFRIIQVDLPGFGQSEPLPSSFSIEDVAREVLNALSVLKVQECIVAGHSLGGYIALSMVEQQPQTFSKLILLHSTAYPDSSEKKENRNKVVDFVNRNGALAFTSGFIPPLFADQNHPAIETVREIAIQANRDVVIGYTVAMRDRPDRTSLLKQFHKPILIIGGEKDQAIPLDSIRSQALLSPQIRLHVLREAAHMGMFEKPQETVSAIKSFAGESNRQ
jgi:pimeloyl-ACP methyl ester carboxylesterase